MSVFLLVIGVTSWDILPGIIFVFVGHRMMDYRQGVVLQDIMQVVRKFMRCRNISLAGVDLEVKRDEIWIAMVARHFRVSSGGQV